MNLSSGWGPRRLLPLLVLGGLLAPGGGSADEDAALPPGLRDTGERFRYAPTDRTYRLLRDDASGRKALLGPDGVLRESVEEAVLAEEASLSPLRRAVHFSLWPAVEEPARSGEVLRLVLVLQDNPLPAIAAAARERVAPAVEPRLARLREVLTRIGPLRAEDPEGELQVGHRLEEEARLMTADEREECGRLRREVHDLLEGMRKQAFEEARPLAMAALDPVEAAVLRIPGARVLGRTVLLQALSAEVPAGAVEGLLRDRPEIRRVLPHETRRVGLDTSVPTIGASSWTGAGYDGSSSTKVAVLDTGVDSAHPALQGIFANQAVFLQTAKNISGFADNANSTDDIFGHGTHVAGIVMSQKTSQNTTYQGVAPGGLLLNAKCGYRLLYQGRYYGSLEDADIMAAGDWAAGQGASVFSCSFGAWSPGVTTDGSSGLAHFFDAAVEDLGISVAVAAGNDGASGPGTVGSPGDGFNVLTVGAFSDNETTTQTDNSIASFSSRGPLSDGRRKPDLAAPGVQISSCNWAWEGANADFVALPGTSMATPHVAGAFALLDDYAASSRPEGAKALLLGTTRNTSPYPTSPDSSWGTGGLNLAAAFTDRASVYESTFSNTAVRSLFLRAPSLSSGQRVTLCWSREVLSNGSGAPTTYRAPADLDLFVYEESDDTTRGSSVSGLDTVEQVKLLSSSTFPIVKVKRNGSFPSGQTAIQWAIATETTTAAQVVSPPSLSCAFTTIPAFIGGNQQFLVTVTVTNSGDLPATTPAVTLTLPANYSVVGGSNPQAIGTIPAAGDSRQASWTVLSAASGTGPVSFSAVASTTSFGESFSSVSVSRNQTLDAQAPSCSVSIEAGRVAVSGPAVDLRVTASDALSGVASMRLRNLGGLWGAWQAYSTAAVPWTLDPGEGPQTVEAQAMDGAGNISPIASDSIFVDTTAPTGTFAVHGGAVYAMPWEDLAANLAGDDGAGGSGVVAFRYRWGSGLWSSWVDLLGGNIAPLARPGGAGPLLVEGQFRDAADNLSPTANDRIHLVEAAPPSLTAVKSWKGALSPGGDVDAFVLDALSGDVLTLGVQAKPPGRGADFTVVVDLFRPSRQRTTAGLDPKDAGKAGFRKQVLAETGLYWIVVSSSGAASAAGASVGVSVKVSSPPENRRRAGTIYPALDFGVVSASFDGAAGSTMRAALRGTVTGPVLLRTPSGEDLPLEVSEGGGGLRVAPLVLSGGTGEYALRFPASSTVDYRVDLKPPKRGKAVEE